MRIRKSLLWACSPLLLTTGILFAQQLYIGPTNANDIKWAKKADFDGSILFCRGHYVSNRYEENGSGWFTDYPGADNNFLVRLAELTEVRVRFSPDRIPFHVVVGLHDPLLHKCPIVYISDAGTMALDEWQIRNLTHYFHQGGFLWVDDFWGSEAWNQWEYEIRKVLPSALYPMIDIPNDHAILHMLYDVPNGVPQMPTVGLWGDGIISERGEDSKDVHFRGITDERGRIIVVMTHNTDIADGFEDRMDENAGISFEYSQKFSSTAYALAINIWIYAMTH